MVKAGRAYDPGAPAVDAQPVGGQPLRDEALLDWAREVVDAVVDRAPDGAGAAS